MEQSVSQAAGTVLPGAGLWLRTGPPGQSNAGEALSGLKASNDSATAVPPITHAFPSPPPLSPFLSLDLIKRLNKCTFLAPLPGCQPHADTEMGEDAAATVGPSAHPPGMTEEERQELQEELIKVRKGSRGRRSKGFTTGVGCKFSWN